jgi:vitellogenic carboxypeptidase-like protein
VVLLISTPFYMFLLLAFLGHCHRDEAYDAADLTSIFFNLPHVQANIRAHPNTTYVSCSPQVDAAFGGDVMKSTAKLVPDMLAWSHLLLYQGQWDAECGVASNEAWISKLQW